MLGLGVVSREENHMTRTIFLSTVAVALLGAATMSAQAQPAAAPAQPASFFVAENPNGSGNLGGLAGADQMWQTQAQALGGQPPEKPGTPISARSSGVT